MNGGLSAIILGLLAFVIYFLPTVVAAKRNHSNGSSIAALNLLLGWTLLGWVAALVWSFSSDKKTPEPKTQASLVEGVKSSSDMMDCPFCAERIKAKAKFCRFCNKELPKP